MLQIFKDISMNIKLKKTTCQIVIYRKI